MLAGALVEVEVEVEVRVSRYEFCEFNKVLKAVYTPNGYVYVPTNYHHEDPSQLLVSVDLSAFTSYRQSALEIRKLAWPRKKRKLTNNALA